MALSNSDWEDLVLVSFVSFVVDEDDELDEEDEEDEPLEDEEDEEEEGDNGAICASVEIFAMGSSVDITGAGGARILFRVSPSESLFLRLELEL